MALRAAELEILYTADITDVERKDKAVKDAGERTEKTPVKKKILGDEKDALAGMDRVEKAAKRLVSQDTALKLDADITRAEKNLDRAKQRLEDLSVRALGGLDVTADTKRAEAALSKIERNLDGLRTARSQIEIDADTVKAEAELEQLTSKARDAGAKAGDAGGRSLSEGLDSATRGAGEKVGAVVGGDIEGTLVSALAAIPVAGGVILAGVAIGKAITGAIQDGLAQEVGIDRLQGLTGISEADAIRLARVAGEAYTRNFGESIEANMDTTRLALQFDLIDDDTTTRQAQRVVEGLAGIADALGEDVQPVATAVTTLLRNGLAKSADEAYDLLASGAQKGLNRNQDLLDTLTEYPVVLERLGLSGAESLGLINQGLEAGARNTDVVADALKEFQIRATDATELSAAGYERLGLSAEEMTAKIARGGADAREGLDIVLDRLRATEDPVQRNAAAVELFGTKAEDLGEALFALDLDTAASQFDTLEGSARRMFDTLASNDASKIESAQRNIEVAADGIKGALAAAFSEPLGELADFVSRNRGPVMQFLLDMANGALDFGENMVNAAADGSEALGEFIAGPGADMLQTIADVQKFINPFADTSAIDATIASMRGFDDTTEAAADQIRDRLLPGINDARDRMNEFGEGAVAMGYLNDASYRLAESMAAVGVGADGARIGLEGIDLANLRASDSGKILDDQIRSAIGALLEEVDAAAAAGEGQDELAARYRNGTEALVSQLTQMGLTEEQARSLTDEILRTPAARSTAFSSNAGAVQAGVQSLADRIITLPDGRVFVQADTDNAYQRLQSLQSLLREITGQKNLRVAMGPGGSGGITEHDGGIVEFMAQGGIRGGLTPMAPIATVVPPSTWRVVGDRSDVAEAYIPLNRDPRSLAILLEAMRRMGVTPMAAGGITDTRSGAGGSPVAMTNYITPPPDQDPLVFVRTLSRDLAAQLGWR